MGQIIKAVCICQSCQFVSVSVCEHSHGRISWFIFAKIGTDVKTPKSKNEFIGGQYRTTSSPILSSQNLHFRPRGPENPCKYYICLKLTRIAKIFACLRKSGSKITMVTSDFRLEVEIRPYCACAMHTAIIIGTVRL